MNNRSRVEKLFVHLLEHKELERYLNKAFPTLNKLGLVEDVINDAAIRAIEQSARLTTDGSDAQMRGFIIVTLKRTALDALRKLASRIVVDIEGDQPGPDTPSPVHEQERRSQQINILSQVLREFVSWCESRESGYVMKQMYERRLRGQTPSQIAEQMQTKTSHVNTVMDRARGWIFEHLSRNEEVKSIFETIFVSPRRPKKPVKVNGDTIGTMGDVIRWVIQNTDAMCPSNLRLRQYAASPGRPELQDVAYHVKQAPCRICQVELDYGLILRDAG